MKVTLKIFFTVASLVCIASFYYKVINNAGQKQQYVDCIQGGGCVYPEEVDLRIIVMTFNRAKSLRKLLTSLDDLELDGDSGMLEIWIDRKKTKDLRDGKNVVYQDTVDSETLNVARGQAWSRGQTRVHVQKRHVGIYGQWIDTWRPRPGSNELALLLEDDLSLSPYAYRWLKAVHRKYGSRHDIAGYTLQSEGVDVATGRKPIRRPKNDSVFLYKLLGSWGYAPHPTSWTHFQDWYREVRKNTSFRPYVPAATKLTGWYKKFEKTNKADTMWTIWHVYYSDKYNMFTVYNNIQALTANSSCMLAANRREPGLHFGRKGTDLSNKLLRQWSNNYIMLPDIPVCYDWNGTVLE